MQAEIADLLESFCGLHIMRFTLHLNLTGHLKVVLLLADERLVYLGVVETFVCTYYVGWCWSEKD